MAEAGQHRIARTQILVDGFGLGGRLDDEDVHACFATGPFAEPGLARDRRGAFQGLNGDGADTGRCAQAVSTGEIAIAYHL